MKKSILESITNNCKIFLFIAFSLNMRPLNAQNLDSVDIISYKIDLDFVQFKSSVIAGSCEISCQAVSGLNPKTIQLMLLKLKVDSVLYRPGKSLVYHKLNFKYNDTFLTVAQAPEMGAALKIYYNGSPKRDATWGGFYFQSDYAYNMGVGFSAEPHPFGRTWFPCLDNFTDKALFSYSIRVPKGYVAVCGGNLKNTSQNPDQSTTWQWEHSIPINTYLASVAVAPYHFIYDSYAGTQANIPIMMNGEAKDTGNLRKSFIHLKRAMKVFENFYGPYRFERVGYSLVPFDAGAMEHACNVAYPRIYADGTLSYETLMAHELSHHWWGNNTTCSSAGDMWLNEGWASYSEALFKEEVYGKKAYQDYMNDFHKLVLQFAHVRDGAATAINKVSSANTYGLHVYKKGPTAIHSLRSVMGDDDFKEKCRSLMEKYKQGSISTEQFSQHFNVPGDLVNQLISDTGFAHFSIYSLQSVKEGNAWKNTVHYKQKKRFGHHVYENIPFELMAFDQNFKMQTFKVTLGTPKPLVFYTTEKPAYVCFDYHQKFSDAVTDAVIFKDSVGTYNLSYALMSVTVNESSDSSLIRVEHNWVYPDAYFLNVPNVVISKERYWTVGGIFDASLKASAVINYDGSKPTTLSGWLDAGLLENRQEDSIILLYRPNAESQWQIEKDIIKTIGGKADKKGAIKINNLKMGEYALGVYGKPVISGFKDLQKKELKIYPNPADNEVNFEWGQGFEPGQINIYNSMGSKVLGFNTENKINSCTIDSSHFLNGVYYVLAGNYPIQNKISGRFLIAR